MCQKILFISKKWVSAQELVPVSELHDDVNKMAQAPYLWLI